MKFLSLNVFLLSFLLNLSSLNVSAGICDISGSGIGGTGAPALKDNGSGIGGTGFPTSKSNGSGIGGTGAIANGSGIGGTGQKTDDQASIIIGTITGFGSICINGIEIHYAPSTPVQINGETASAEQLALGQIASVNISGTGSEVFAKDIHVMNIVTGSITEIDLQLNRVTVLGQIIQFSAKTHFPQDQTKGSTLQKGHFIQVSGLRRTDGEIIASRIDSTGLNNHVQISGVAKNVTTNGLMIHDVAIKTHGGITVSEGQKVSIRGYIEAGALVAKQIIIPKIADGQSFRMEGLVSIDAKGEHIKVGHLAVQTTDQIKNMLLTLPKNQSVIIDGSMMTEHSAKIEHLFIQDSFDHDEVQPIHQPHYDEHIDSKSHDNEIDENEQEKPEVEEHETDEDTEHHEEIEIKTPEIEKIETQEVDHSEADEIESPELETSETEAPELESSEIEIHEVEESEVETPEIEVPEIEESEVEPPEIEVPEVDTPEIEVPETEVPEVDTPEIEVPEIEVPEVDTPEIEVPEIEVPEVETPEIEVPEIEVPEVETPEIEVPEIEVPEVNTPEIEVPEIETPEIEDIE